MIIDVQYILDSVLFPEACALFANTSPVLQPQPSTLRCFQLSA